MMRVVITRSENNTKTLCEKINALGGSLISFPVIEFYPTRQQALLKQTIEQLNTTKIAIFVSQNAVHFTLPPIQQYWKTLPPIQWAAIGPATEKTLQDHGIKTIITALNPPYESESLLAVPELQAPQIADQSIVIFRGNGGRDTLNQVLTHRGAIVHWVESYERRLPAIAKTEIVKKLNKWRKAPIDVLVITSAESLKHFLMLVGSEIEWLKEIPTIVVGLRMHKLANKLQFKKAFMAMGADDASILEVVTQLKGW